ncbi:MAG: hypothetical protein A3B25_01695 [Candidatus Ryanbacteria bacterium RIFCSPLOWO2_01_FULL_48_26]|uniref:Uncharacterized protein n=1 Tax=Candidatus Ryanbacteria bacterium RIFCSPLOWO2_01_FULL_48_26 TaxID=1802126 RepID=A0A1G2GXP6_9BACT|nr:MAG: hypothetical protein A3B25_01695 [Candidatus Ryanbacteria bacterium RIFCSPLOWO2_01_FULL_48_26]
MKKANKSIFVTLLLVVIAVGLLGVGSSFNGSATRAPDGTGVSEDPVPCINPILPIPAEYHIHPVLKIVADGKNIEVPMNIGLSLFGCERAVHTHDNTGTIHIEPNYYQAFTLGDFFWVWQKDFSKDKVLDYIRDAEHEIVMTVDGTASAEFENLVLKDNQQIIITYEAIKKLY